MKNNMIKAILSFLIFMCISNGIIANGIAPFQNPQNQLFFINEEITYLEEIKARYLALALIHEEQGMRWQFDPHLKQEARRSLRLADAERKVMQEIQERIDDLCTRRDILLKLS